MAVEFPIGTKTIVFGRVANPVIPLLVQTRRGFVPFDFLIDTGADCTMLPASIAETEIGPHIVRLRCAFSSHEHSPLILGRLDLFSHFTLAFDNRRHVIRFTKLTR